MSQCLKSRKEARIITFSNAINVNLKLLPHRIQGNIVSLFPPLLMHKINNSLASPVIKTKGFCNLSMLTLMKLRRNLP